MPRVRFPCKCFEYPGIFDGIGWFTDEELVGTVDGRIIAVGFDFATILSSSFCSCILFAIVLGQLIKLKGAEMADVEQMKKIIPFVTCGITFGGQYVCELVFGVDVPNLNLEIHIHPIKQPIQSNSVGS